MAKQVTTILSHWYQLFEGFQYSSKDFYSQVASAIKSRNVPNLKLSKITYREGGPLSAKREYLRLERRGDLFDLCAAPFGNGFFVSWWLGNSTGAFIGLLLSIPVFGAIFSYFIRPLSYYKIDVALMFQESVRQAVLEVIDNLSKTSGLRELSESDRKPILRELSKR